MARNQRTFVDSKNVVSETLCKIIKINKENIQGNSMDLFFDINFINVFFMKNKKNENPIIPIDNIKSIYPPSDADRLFTQIGLVSNNEVKYISDMSSFPQTELNPKPVIKFSSL